ncbi:MAG: hypothetical protein AAB489_00735 [Patescibacteria group bacterium]
MNRKDRISAFVETVWDWYGRHKRDLPWRDLRDADPAERGYKILVSEVMLQQTQVSRVEIMFRSFLERFPKIQDLASASNRDVILAWRGMGYNSRALRLRDAAKIIITRSSVACFLMEHRKGETSNELTSNEFPYTMEDLLQIPGIGEYTAAAIRNFAFNLPTPCIDTNIRRILHRTFVGPENADGTWRKDDRYLFELAGEILEVALKPVTHYSLRVPRFVHATSNQPTSNEPPSAEHAFSGQKSFQRTAADWHAALMDYGSLVQTKTNPKWNVCPLTAKGIMKAMPKDFLDPKPETRNPKLQKEPGRLVGSTFIPNRIFRGKVVEILRDAPKGLTLDHIGREVCLDWEKRVHQKWLSELLSKLMKDAFVQRDESRYRLRE